MTEMINDSVINDVVVDEQKGNDTMNTIETIIRVKTEEEKTQIENAMKMAGLNVVVKLIGQKNITDKLQYEDGLAICQHNHEHKFNIDELDEATANECKKSGLCPQCLAILKMANEIKSNSPKRTTVNGGKNVGQKMQQLVENLDIDEETLMKLTTKEFSKVNIGYNFPMFIIVDNMNKDEISEARKVNNYPRYYSRVFTVANHKVLLCSNIFDKQLEKAIKFFG